MASEEELLEDKNLTSRIGTYWIHCFAGSLFEYRVLADISLIFL
jgi:hypothetical protein